MISVIIPAYNCERYLAEAVGSALNQTLSDIEVLIIDDCSKDRTREIACDIAAQDRRVRVIENSENLGVAASRNLGFDTAVGEFVALLDADDWWFPSKLEKQLTRLKATDSDVCYSSYAFIDHNGAATGRVPYMAPESTNVRLHLRENVIGCSTAVFRRDITESVRMRGEFTHEDYVFWLELIQKGYKFTGIREPLAKYRVLRTSRSWDKRKAAKGRWRIYRDFAGLGILASCAAFAGYAASAVRKRLTTR